MAYLIFPRKWKLEGEIITHKKWKEYNETKGGGRKEEVPKTIFVIFEGKFFKTATRGLRRNRAINWVDVRESSKGYGTCYCAQGSSTSVMYAEQLLALGARRFIIIGEAGSLDPEVKPESIVLCNKALRDEGTSYHYIKPSKYAFPSKTLTERIAKIFEEQRVKYSVGPSWTADAPFRETKAEAIEYAKQGIKTVEMEAASLFAFAQRRNVEAAAVFVVSDHVLHDKGWKPMFHKTLPSLMCAYKALAGRV